MMALQIIRMIATTIVWRKKRRVRESIVKNIAIEEQFAKLVHLFPLAFK